MTNTSTGMRRQLGGKWRTLRPGDALRLAAILAIVLIMGFPVFMTFATGFFPNGELVRSGLTPSLDRLTLDNFAEALLSIPLVQQLGVSVVVVVVQSLAQLLTSALAAYALVFPSWRGRGIAFAIIVATMAVPGESLVIPNYELVSSLGLRDTVLGIVVPFLAIGYPIFLLRQAFRSVDRELWEAARLDGCGDLRSLFLVILPTCRNEVTTAALWSALAAWNGFFWPLLITDSPQNRTLQVGLSQLVSGESTSPSVIFAGTALVLIPTVVLVMVSQRLIISGMARGVLK